jgi:putative transcriptional regulator
MRFSRLRVCRGCRHGGTGRAGIGVVHRPPVRALASAVKNRLKELRAARAWSQVELAERLGVSRQTVNALETGRYDPSLPLAFRIARLFDMRIEDVFVYEEDD